MLFRSENDGDTRDYPALQSTMAKEGPKGTTTPPIHVGNVFGTASPADTPQRNPGVFAMGNGGHRVAIASELGWNAMRTTDSKVQSGYGDQRFNKSPAYPSAGHGVPNSYAQQPLMSNQQFAGPHAQVQSQGVMPGMRRSQLP